MKILLYGGTGFLGTNLARHFLNKGGNELVIVSRAVPRLPAENVTYIDRELFQKESEQILRTIDVFFYLIGRAAPRQISNSAISVCDAEIADLEFLISRIAKAKAKSKAKLQFVYLSSGGSVYGESKGIAFCEHDELNPITEYGRVKKSGEEIVSRRATEENIPYLLLRPTNIYGRNQSPKKHQGVISIFADKIRNSKTIDIFGDGNSKKDYLYIDDFLSAVEGLLDSKVSGIYNIGSGFEASVNELIFMLERQLNVQANRNHVRLDAPDVMTLSLNCKKLSNAIRFTAYFNLENGIRDYLKNISQPR